MTHTWGNQKKCVFCTSAGPAESPPETKIPTLVLARFYGWGCRSSRRRKEKGEGALISSAVVHTGSWWMQKASKITQIKSMQGEYPVSDIWTAVFFLICPCQISFSLLPDSLLITICWLSPIQTKITFRNDHIKLLLIFLLF